MAALPLTVFSSTIWIVGHLCYGLDPYCLSVSLHVSHLMFGKNKSAAVCYSATLLNYLLPYSDELFVQSVCMTWCDCCSLADRNWTFASYGSLQELIWHLPEHWLMFLKSEHALPGPAPPWTLRHNSEAHLLTTNTQTVDICHTPQARVDAYLESSKDKLKSLKLLYFA